MRFLFLIIAFGFFSCLGKDEGRKEIRPTRSIVICIQPLGKMGRDDIDYLSEELPRWYHAKVLLSPYEPLPSSAWYPQRSRYSADSLLVFLKGKNKDINTFVLGVTDKDISTGKGANPSWGIMGLGFQPGNACVVSLYRLRKNSRGGPGLKERLLKVVLHELGHNFGLPHCTDQHCIMADAEGRDKLNEEKDLCRKCRAYLSEKGYL